MRTTRVWSQAMAATVMSMNARIVAGRFMGSEYFRVGSMMGFVQREPFIFAAS